MRHWFGQGAADFTMNVGAGDAIIATGGQEVTFWTAATGGSQHIDLLLGGSPVTSITSAAGGAGLAKGSLPAFQGPDSITEMWADAGGGGRYKLTANDLADVVTSLGGGGGGGGGHPWEIVVQGTSDSAVQDAFEEALDSLTGNRLTKPVVVFPPGVYNLSEPWIVPDAGTLNMIEGFQILGSGVGSTVIQWNNGTDPLIEASDPRFRFVKISGMTIDSQNSANVFARLESTQGGVYNQRWHFQDLKFGGTWVRGVGLDGLTTGNLNSEFKFERVETNPSSNWTDAFFHSGLTNHSGENQFLNYWFEDCNFSMASGTALRWTRGGAVRISNGSWSANSSSGTITWLDFPTAQSNQPDRNQVRVEGVRFEPKGSGHKILNSSMADGFIHFDSCSDNASSQNSGSYTHERYTVNANSIWSGRVAPVVRFTNGSHGGYIRYIASGGAQTRGGFVVDGCKWYRGDTGQKTDEIQGGTNPILQWSGSAPNYRFVNGWNYDDLASWSIT